MQFLQKFHNFFHSFILTKLYLIYLECLVLGLVKIDPVENFNANKCSVFPNDLPLKNKGHDFHFNNTKSSLPRMPCARFG